MRTGEYHEGKGVYIALKEDGHYGLYAATVFDGTNQPIIDIGIGRKQNDSDIYTIEIDEGHFLHPYGRYTNHSCDPSAFVDKSSGYLLSTREIAVDEEITFDYLASETNIKANFHCNCGAVNCVDKIGADK